MSMKFKNAISYIMQQLQHLLRHPKSLKADQSQKQGTLLFDLTLIRCLCLQKSRIN